MNSESEYQDIIEKLKILKKIKADESFKKRLYARYVSKNAKSLLFFPAFRLTLTALVLFIILGSGVVVASEKSGPGSLLYPLRTTVEDIQKNLGIKKEVSISPAPTAVPTAAPTQAPTVPTSSRSIPEVTPIPTAIPTPAPSPVASAPKTEAKVNVLGAQINLGLGNNSNPSITPAPTTAPSQILNLDVSINKKPILRIGL